MPRRRNFVDDDASAPESNGALDPLPTPARQRRPLAFRTPMKPQRLVLAAVLALVCLLFGRVVEAQVVTTGPIDTTMKFALDLPPNISQAEAPTFLFRIKDGADVVTELSNPACTTVNGVITCTFPVTQSHADAFNRVGVHSITAALFRADVGEGGYSAPFVLKSPPGAVKAVRITR